MAPLSLPAYQGAACLGPPAQVAAAPPPWQKLPGRRRRATAGGCLACWAALVAAAAAAVQVGHGLAFAHALGAPSASLVTACTGSARHPCSPGSRPLPLPVLCCSCRGSHACQLHVGHTSASPLTTDHRPSLATPADAAGASQGEPRRHVVSLGAPRASLLPSNQLDGLKAAAMAAMRVRAAWGCWRGGCCGVGAGRGWGTAGPGHGWA
jgi:hypothetical protein